MAGKRVKKSEKTVTMENNKKTNSQTKKETIMEQETNTQSTIDAILQINNTVWTKEDLQDLPSSALEKILATEKARAEYWQKTKGRKKNVQFTKAARTVQKFLECTEENKHHEIMEYLINNPHTSGKEIDEIFGIKYSYGQYCVRHARVLLNVLYNNGMLSQERIDKLEDVMAEQE